MTWALALLSSLGREWKLAVAALFAAGFVIVLGQRDVARAQRDATGQALKTEQADHKSDNERAGRERAEQERGFGQTIIAAIERKDARAAGREPIIVHSTNTVREYAETDTGRARCYGTDRVRGLDSYHAALTGAGSGPAGGRAEALRANPDPAPAGR